MPHTLGRSLFPRPSRVTQIGCYHESITSISLIHEIASTSSIATPVPNSFACSGSEFSAEVEMLSATCDVARQVWSLPSLLRWSYPQHLFSVEAFRCLTAGLSARKNAIDCAESRGYRQSQVLADYVLTSPCAGAAIETKQINNSQTAVKRTKGMEETKQDDHFGQTAHRKWTASLRSSSKPF